MDPIRILIAEDHQFMRFGIRTGLSRDPQLEILEEEATTGAEAIALAEKLAPDVILMDIDMPGVNGIDATRNISHASPRIGILILTVFDDDKAFAAIRAGARGYLLKDEPVEKVIEAIRIVSQGESFLSPKIAQRVVEHFRRAEEHSKSRPTPDYTQILPELTPREREILSLVAQGYTNTAIAEKLSLSQKGVRNRVSEIYDKLHVANRVDAVLLARREGLVHDQGKPNLSD
jgi:DNA-binding NarL/FixJ family response regulator